MIIRFELFFIQSTLVTISKYDYYLVSINNVEIDLF
jgi:hypothetical protein